MAAGGDGWEVGMTGLRRSILCDAEEGYHRVQASELMANRVSMAGSRSQDGQRQDGG